jgi:hypothetical protein
MQTWRKELRLWAEQCAARFMNRPGVIGAILGGSLVRVRGAMNDLILAFHWAHRELPRSQNRTDSRLRLICRKHGAPEFYRLYRDVFHLDNANRVIRSVWPGLREQVLEVTRLWGDPARDFFDFAVDSHFQWRQNADILTVYRLYVPVIGGEERGILGKLDDSVWRRANPEMLKFLGLDEMQVGESVKLIERIEEAVVNDRGLSRQNLG